CPQSSHVTVLGELIEALYLPLDHHPMAPETEKWIWIFFTLCYYTSFIMRIHGKSCYNMFKQHTNGSKFCRPAGDIAMLICCEYHKDNLVSSFDDYKTNPSFISHVTVLSNGKLLYGGNTCMKKKRVWAIISTFIDSIWKTLLMQIVLLLIMINALKYIMRRIEFMYHMSIVRDTAMLIRLIYCQTLEPIPSLICAPG
ncbi:hypothetical protein ACJX0J_038549, partial [Zea mays]